MADVDELIVAYQVPLETVPEVCAVCENFTVDLNDHYGNLCHKFASSEDVTALPDDALSPCDAITGNYVGQDILQKHQVIRRLSWHGSVMSTSSHCSKKRRSFSLTSPTRPRSLPCLHSLPFKHLQVSPTILGIPSPCEPPQSIPIVPASPIPSPTEQNPTKPTPRKTLHPTICSVYKLSFLYADYSVLSSLSNNMRYIEPGCAYLETKRFPVPVTSLYYRADLVTRYLIDQGNDLDVKEGYNPNPTESQQRGEIFI